MIETTDRHGSRLIAALEHAYGAVREICPDLPTNVIFITGTGRPSNARRSLKYGHFAAERWAERADTPEQEQGRPARAHEILVTGEGLARGAEPAFTTVVHEAVHALARVRNVQETSRQGRYHNRKFVELADELGMEYTHDTADVTHGFSAVTLTDATKQAFAEEIARLDRAIRLAIDGGALKTAAPAKKVRKVILCTFEDGSTVDFGLKKYEEAEPHLHPHTAELIES